VERLRDDNGFWPKQREKETERERIQRARSLACLGTLTRVAAFSIEIRGLLGRKWRSRVAS